MNIIKDTLIKVKGFEFSAMHSGVKRKRRDICLVKCAKGSISAGTLTTNISRAAPVEFTAKSLKKKNVSAILVNSGNANACTGIKGIENCKEIIKKVSELINCEKEEVIISSTGIIGKQLEMNKILPSLPILKKNLSEKNIDLLPESIMTTDTFEKKSSIRFESENLNFNISGFSKGSGMIHPNMATMLAFVFTDVNIDKNLLTKATKEIVEDTFNMISVDGDTSTNDMFLVTSSCKSKNNKITSENEEYSIFKESLFMIAKDLSIMIARDGEGASKLLISNIIGASSKENAKLLAKSIISSNLVKAAFFGNDANWGRIICAMGYSGAKFSPSNINLNLSSKKGNIELMKKGIPIDFLEDKALNILTESEIEINVELKEGQYNATAWGCDLTYDYVKINGEYRT
ncbi:bifunctional glutamate N-acetyltransferase/amino-acid acetyltransferase ArgJ [Helicovermis profundi]|uniref:Arginine biosynthesis bifunctional protein ArgJ n=1 Tax=Helicovermis profundi TaxID=3065157 RepID=A0AAU9EVD7_9FIRM|nr:bifunctional glutamate N-acetyltransferase/amino-acid acetyltransferase ArgJ [Clostridia bacterium S502]